MCSSGNHPLSNQAETTFIVHLFGIFLLLCWYFSLTGQELRICLKGVCVLFQVVKMIKKAVKPPHVPESESFVDPGGC